jgi:predicted ribosome quality control (RQC) complex YloA/Tae2 family protein
MILRSVLQECHGLVGARIDRVGFLDENTIVLSTKPGDLLVSVHPQAPRVHLHLGKVRKSTQSGFMKLLKSKIEGQIIESVEQLGFDRRMLIAAGDFELIVDLMGTKSNLTLIGPAGALGRLRKIASPPKADISLAEALNSRSGLSKILLRELEKAPATDILQKAEKPRPVYYPGIGAYPFELTSISLKPMPMESLSAALQAYYADYLPKLRAGALAKTLRGQLASAIEARSVSLSQIEEVLDTARRSRKLQMFGELILAFSPDAKEYLETVDYEGNKISIPLNSELSAVENAERYFRKAKKAKKAAADLGPRAEKLRNDIFLLETWLQAVDDNPHEVAEAARSQGMLREQQPPPEKRIQKHDGFRVRETEIDGYMIFWGENATANDYVTTRIAKPNDLWLHVRGAHGAHVVIRTQKNKPDVPPKVLNAAAVIAAKNSGQKHASHVPVTYTHAKYVRKPRKSAPGAVIFTNDRTLFVDP